MLMLVILNLLKNSAEAIVSNKQSMGKISIRAHGNETFVSLLVVDNGPGISKEYCEKLFAFGETTKADGHGFGLSSCKKSLQSMGGDLLFHEPKDPTQLGACFEIIVPANAQSLPTAA
jgi:C4-dicarboxylate-specific signal transduction histidine kinase